MIKPLFLCHTFSFFADLSPWRCKEGKSKNKSALNIKSANFSPFFFFFVCLVYHIISLVYHRNWGIYHKYWAEGKAVGEAKRASRHICHRNPYSQKTHTCSSTHACITNSGFGSPPPVCKYTDNIFRQEEAEEPIDIQSNK